MTEEEYRRGKEIRDVAFGKEGIDRWEALNEFVPAHARAIQEYVFGQMWDRPHLEMKFRELIVIACAAAQDLSGEVKLHTRGALNRGATKDEVLDTILNCTPYIGFPKTNHALAAAKEIFDEWEANQEEWKPR